MERRKRLSWRSMALILSVLCVISCIQYYDPKVSKRRRSVPCWVFSFIFRLIKSINSLELAVFDISTTLSSHLTVLRLQLSLSNDWDYLRSLIEPKAEFLRNPKSGNILPWKEELWVGLWGHPQPFIGDSRDSWCLTGKLPSFARFH